MSKAIYDPHDGRAGSLVMQAIGDAVGFVVEGYGPDVCAPYADNVFIDGQTPMRSGYPFGQYSDDTQLARELALSLAESVPRMFQPELFAQRVARMFANNEIVGRGSATEAAARKHTKQTI